MVTTMNTPTTASMEVITEPTVKENQVKENIYNIFYLCVLIIISTILISLVTWKCLNIQSSVE